MSQKKKSQIIMEFDYFITTKEFGLIEKEIRQIIADKLQTVIHHNHIIRIYGNRILGDKNV